jgi:hypothetical protein
MNDFCFVCVAFNPEYVEQQVRLRRSIFDIYPDATCFFWTDRLPPGSKVHGASHYGFKVHAVQYAREQGFNKIIFFDPACVLVKKVDYWFDLVKDYGVVAAEDTSLLYQNCSQEAFDFFGITKQDAIEKKYHLVGGSLYVFDFDLPICGDIFEMWKQAELSGIFLSPENAPQHRNDEACMALSLYKHGSKPVSYDICGYNDVPDPIVKKFHFK